MSIDIRGESTKGGISKRGRPKGAKNTRKNEPLFLSRSGVTLQEIAEAVATTPQAVKNLLDRGIKTERKKRQILEALERIRAEKKER